MVEFDYTPLHYFVMFMDTHCTQAKIHLNSTNKKRLRISSKIGQGELIKVEVFK